MKEYIHLQEYVNDKEWVENVQWRVNHDKCPAGEDTRQRLYIKCIAPSGSYIGYCHNCGGHGSSIKQADYRPLSALLQDRGKDTIVPSATNSSIVEMHKKHMVPITHLHSRVWLYGWHTDEADWEEMGLKQHDYEGWIYIPVGECSLQIRAFNSGSNRYYTFFHPDEKKHYYTSPKTFTENRGVVITEDAISSYRVERDLEYASFACLGTNISDSLKNRLRNIFSTPIHIWFDGDSAGRRASQKIHNELSSTSSSPIHIVVCDKSPKEYSPEDLKEVWESHIASIK